MLKLIEEIYIENSCTFLFSDWGSNVDVKSIISAIITKTSWEICEANKQNIYNYTLFVVSLPEHLYEM